MFFNTADVALLTDAPERTLDQWFRDKVVEPTVNARKGQSRRFVAVDVLAVTLLVSLRNAKIGSLEAGRAIAKLIQSHTEAELVAKFARGQKFILLIGDDVIPDLLAEKVVFDKEMKKQASAAGIHPIAINLEVAYKSLQEKVVALVDASRKGE